VLAPTGICYSSLAAPVRHPPPAGSGFHGGTAVWQPGAMSLGLDRRLFGRPSHEE
jgi:hypothetical protein